MSPTPLPPLSSMLQTANNEPLTISMNPSQQRPGVKCTQEQPKSKLIGNTQKKKKEKQRRNQTDSQSIPPSNRLPLRTERSSHRRRSTFYFVQQGIIYRLFFASFFFHFESNAGEMSFSTVQCVFFCQLSYSSVFCFFYVEQSLLLLVRFFFFFEWQSVFLSFAGGLFGLR